MPRDKAVF